MKKNIILLAGLLCTYFSHSQEQHKCGAHHKEQALWKQDPTLETKYLAFQEAMSAKNSRSTDTLLTIPIVFHVIHEYGVENISDDQIYRQMEILNEDFRKLNADTSVIVPDFIPVAADVQIEFRLADIDPFGNCTNGINRYFSPETNIGDDFSKLNQWPRNRYLNVWVVRSMENGVAGYAYFPSSVEGNNRFRDGIAIRHNYIGDIGTSNPSRSRTLTHEIGHWLGLAHPWGPTNDPGLTSNCSTDDGIADTPNTIGWTTCNLSGTSCDGFLDNVQNYMDYSFCSNMFTNGQAEFMRNAAKSDVSQRSFLWSEQNFDLVFSEQESICAPVADFYSNRFACLGEAVTFQNHSWRLYGESATYNWEFEDATSSVASDFEPEVSFLSPGWKDVRLSVTVNGQTHSVVKEDFIFISPEWASFVGPQQFDFENEDAYAWTFFNPYNHQSSWKHELGVGNNLSQGVLLEINNPYQDPVLFTPEYFYGDRLGGIKQNLISPAIDLSFTSGVTVTFDFACATNATLADDMSEVLNVYISSNCGRTWIKREDISGVDLINNGSGWSDFRPNQNTIWSTGSFTIPDNYSERTLIRFEYVASDFSNNLAIDNVMIDGLLSIESVETSRVKVVPNPTSGDMGWRLSYEPGMLTGGKYFLYDPAGSVVRQGDIIHNNQVVIPSDKLAKGLYILSVEGESFSESFKLLRD